MRLHYAALAVILFTATGVFAQAPVAPPTEPIIVICPGVDTRCPPAQPLPAAGIPDTKKGAFDWLAKAMPVIWTFGVPLAMVLIRIGAPYLVSVIPGKFMPVASAAITALAAALTATGTDAVLDGAGGVQPFIAAIEAGPAAGIVHYGLNQVAKQAEDKVLEAAPIKKG